MRDKSPSKASATTIKYQKVDLPKESFGNGRLMTILTPEGYRYYGYYGPELVSFCSELDLCWEAAFPMEVAGYPLQQASSLQFHKVSIDHRSNSICTFPDRSSHTSYPQTRSRHSLGTTVGFPVKRVAILWWFWGTGTPILLGGFSHVSRLWYREVDESYLSNCFVFTQGYSLLRKINQPPSIKETHAAHI